MITSDIKSNDATEFNDDSVDETVNDSANDVAECPFELEEGEHFKQHPDYSDYIFTDHGRVYSTKAKRFVGYLNQGNGYRQVTLNPPRGAGNLKSNPVYIHKMVMQLFGPPKPSPEYEIDHRDTCSTNNNIENLRWITHVENLYNRNPYKPHNRITKAEVNTVKDWYVNNFNNLQELSPRSIANLAYHELEIPISADCIRINRSKWDALIQQEHFSN